MRGAACGQENAGTLSQFEWFSAAVREQARGTLEQQQRRETVGTADAEGGFHPQQLGGKNSQDASVRTLPPGSAATSPTAP